MTEPLKLSLCTSINDLSGLALDKFVMEPKLDGFRLQVIIEGGTVTTYTRSEHVATGKMPAAETAFADYLDVLDGTILDGEAVFINPEGAADFHWTACVMGSGVDVAAEKQRQSGNYVSFIAFDILRLQGNDVRGLPLKDRRLLLERIVSQLDSPYVRITEQVAPSQAAHLEFTERYGEGSVVKALDAPYVAGRSKHNLKWKKVLDEDVIVLGSEPGKGKFEGMVGAVRFGQVTDSPPATHKCTPLCKGSIHERGKCSGMTDDVRREMTERLPVGAVMVITHNGVLRAGGLRHPQFQYFRFDKPVAECVWTEE